MRRLFARTLVFVFLTAFLGTVPAFAAPATLNPTADSYVYSTSPTSNYGSATTTRSGFWVEFQQKFISLLKFDLSDLPDDAVITSAELKLYLSSGMGSGTMSAARNTEDWTESSVNWSTRPSNDDPRAAALVSSGSSYVTWDVTELVSDWFTGEHTNYGFSIVATAQETDFSADFFSREAGGNQPELIITYDRPLPTPTPTPTPTTTPTPTPTPTPSIESPAGEGETTQPPAGGGSEADRPLDETPTTPTTVGTETPTPEAPGSTPSGRRTSTPSASGGQFLASPLLFISIVSGLLGVGVLGYVLYKEIKKRRAQEEQEAEQKNEDQEVNQA